MTARVVGSSVANMRASASTPAAVSRLNSVDLPALVYPAIEIVGIGRPRRGLAMKRASSPDVFQILLEFFDARRDAAAIRFQLGFTGAAGTDAAAKAFVSDAPWPGKAREHVFQVAPVPPGGLRRCARAGRRYRGSALGAVDDLGAGSFFEVALLGGSEFVVDDQDIRMMRFRQFLPSSLTLPGPKRVAASTSGRAWNNSAAICAPALEASSASSRKDSWAARDAPPRRRSKPGKDCLLGGVFE